MTRKGRSSLLKVGRSLPYDPELQGRRQPRQLSPRRAQGGRDIHPQRVLQILLNGTEQSINSNTLIYISIVCKDDKTIIHLDKKS